MLSQNWNDLKYCQDYAATWEISTDEVHYGWLAPGEKSLRLLPSITPQKPLRVLEVGCGMGENLITLATSGASCFGVDISQHMIEFARRNCQRVLSNADHIRWTIGDMRELSNFVEGHYDLVLSVYSLEYLQSVDQFRSVVNSIFNRLSVGGSLVFCFSHPLQHFRHSDWQNASARSDLEPFGTSQAAAENTAPLIYSFRDVTEILCETGFTLERIIEQSTEKPSQISYEEGKQYPYHFLKDKNPCRQEYDEISNTKPHTVIYRSTKPGTPGKRASAQPNERVRLWGQYRTVVEKIPIQAADKHLSLLRLAPKDSLVGICQVLQFLVTQEECSNDQMFNLKVSCDTGTADRSIPANSLLGIVLERLHREGYDAIIEEASLEAAEHGSRVTGIFIERLETLRAELREKFSSQLLGLLVFVNDAEPGGGTIGLVDVLPAAGDKVELVYILSGWGSQWRQRKSDFVQGQLFR